MKFTEAAVDKFKEMMKQDKKESVRVFLFKSCCSTILMIDAADGKPGDKLVKQDGTAIYIDPDTFTQFAQVEVDCVKGELKINGMPGAGGDSCCG